MNKKELFIGYDINDEIVKYEVRIYKDIFFGLFTKVEVIEFRTGNSNSVNSFQVISI